LANFGEMDDPEPDLRLDPSGAGSNTVTLREPDGSMPTEDVSFVGIFFAGPCLGRFSCAHAADRRKAPYGLHIAERVR
jgi:hypothetical protein